MLLLSVVEGTLWLTTLVGPTHLSVRSVFLAISATQCFKAVVICINILELKSNVRGINIEREVFKIFEALQVSWRSMIEDSSDHLLRDIPWNEQPSSRDELKIENEPHVIRRSWHSVRNPCTDLSYAA